MGSIDFNKALDSVLGGVNGYFDRKLFSSNPQAASAYYGALSGQAPAPTQGGYTTSTTPQAPASGSTKMDPMVMALLGVGLGAAVMTIMK